MRKSLCLLLSCFLLFSGCRGIGGDSPNHRAVAQMLSIDLLGEQYQVSARILSEDGKPDSYRTVTEQGETISDAVYAISGTLGKELFLRDTRLILLGETLCEEGVGTSLRYLTDGFEIRPRAALTAVKGIAADYLAADDGFPAPVDEIVSILQWSAGSSGAGTTVLELDRNINASGGDGYLPLVATDEEGTAAVAGGILLQKEKTSCQVRQEEMDGIKLLFLVPKGETLVAELDGAKAVVEFTSCSRKLRAEIAEGQPAFTLNGSYSFKLLEWTGPSSAPDTGKLEKAVRQKLTTLLEAAVRLSVFDAGADLLQMDSTLRRDQPQWWRENGQRWQEQRENSVFYLNIRCSAQVRED